MDGIFFTNPDVNFSITARVFMHKALFKNLYLFIIFLQFSNYIIKKLLNKK